jgi:integrase
LVDSSTTADCYSVRQPCGKPFVQATPAVGFPQFCFPAKFQSFIFVVHQIYTKMKRNEISANQLNTDAQGWLEKLRQVLLIQSKGTVKSYTAEMILLFKYYNSKKVASITQGDIEQYIVYIKTVHKVGRAKCRSLASACTFFYKLVIKNPYLLPSALYPQKQFVLPNIMSKGEVAQLFASPLTLKEYCVIGLLYGSGLRISEVAALRIQDIDSAAKRIKVVQNLPRHFAGAKALKTGLPCCPVIYWTSCGSIMCPPTGRRNTCLPAGKRAVPFIQEVCNWW